MYFFHFAEAVQMSDMVLSLHFLLACDRVFLRAFLRFEVLQK